ncbi:heme ABC transporter permease [Pseudoteredinibacter isoporae]|uniref:heme ABC transporter permease n=1 Tax=Pseudoteredinibacter isoporae TaxID=570281 RepID=UPI00334146DA
MAWQWFHRLGSPKWFYEKTNAWMPWLLSISLLMIVSGSIWALGFAPMDAKQGNSYRIMYLHVPASIVAMAAYYVMAVAGAIGLIWKMKLSYMVMKVAAPIGAVLTAMALFTGAVWGKPTWGTYWVWDARLTSVLILLFLYLGVIALQEAFREQEVADKASAILSLVGTVNIPIIYKSVDWWFTLHQPASIKMTSSSIAPEMLYPLLGMITGFYIFFTWALLAATRSEILQREMKTNWVKHALLNKV